MKSYLKNICVKKDYTIKQIVEIMDEGSKGIVLVIDDDEKLIGTVTDGDIRRAIIKSIHMECKINDIIQGNPIVAQQGLSKEEIKDIFIKKAIRQLPIVNAEGILVDFITINDILINVNKPNNVIIMAGGLGTRLKELTKELPKPMLKIGDEPILQHTINGFKKYGYNNIIISVNYKSEIIENYFQDGYAHGVKIKYIRENKRLGTCGGIKLAEELLDEDFFVINGDIFSNINFEHLMDFHKSNNSDLTVCVRNYDIQIPYGVVKTENHNILKIEEKPKINFLINAGIYCLKPDVLKYIPDNEYFEITDLIYKCINNNKKVLNYEIKDYWMDIGQISDYYKVNDDYNKLGGAGRV